MQSEHDKVAAWARRRKKKGVSYRVPKTPSFAILAGIDVRMHRQASQRPLYRMACSGCRLQSRRLPQRGVGMPAKGREAEGRPAAQKEKSSGWAARDGLQVRDRQAFSIEIEVLKHGKCLLSLHACLPSNAVNAVESAASSTSRRAAQLSQPWTSSRVESGRIGSQTGVCSWQACQFADSQTRPCKAVEGQSCLCAPGCSPVTPSPVLAWPLGGEPQLGPRV